MREGDSSVRLTRKEDQSNFVFQRRGFETHSAMIDDSSGVPTNIYTGDELIQSKSSEREEKLTRREQR